MPSKHLRACSTRITNYHLQFSIYVNINFIYLSVSTVTKTLVGCSRLRINETTPIGLMQHAM